MINRLQVITTASIYLPEENLLTEDQIESLLENVIVNQIEENTEENTPKATCLLLKAIGETNLAKYSTFQVGLKRDKAREGELEYFDSDRGIRAWKAFLSQLKNICPIFGYNGLSSSFSAGIKITPGEAQEVNPYCPKTLSREDLFFPSKKRRRGYLSGNY